MELLYCTVLYALYLSNEILSSSAGLLLCGIERYGVIAWCY